MSIALDAVRTCLLAARGGMVTDRYLCAAAQVRMPTLKSLVTHLRWRGHDVQRVYCLGYRIAETRGGPDLPGGASAEKAAVSSAQDGAPRPASGVRVGAGRPVAANAIAHAVMYTGDENGR